jgi:hypothetical protein
VPGADPRVPASPPGDRCSRRSLAADEPLAGTASTIRHWLLIEHTGPWGRDGLLDARLPEGLGRDLRALEARTDARVLLIRRTGRTPGHEDGRVLCFGVDTRDAWLGSVVLDRIQDAARLDPRDPSSFPGDPRDEPLFVVCTHGRRDPCCAERGRPLARALVDEFRGVTWESTHVGGDRFAGNLVAFPHGLYFGRVDAEEAPAIARAYAEGRIGRLDRYRGRSSDPFHVQAADRALRGHLGLDAIDAVTREVVDRRGDLAEVTFATPNGPFRVRVERTRGAPMRLTCHAATEEAPPIWRVLAIDRAGERPAPG